MPSSFAFGPRPLKALPELATVTVTFWPDLAILRTQLMEIPQQALRIVVDNASPEELRVQLRALVHDVGAELIENDTNLGLATATNLGIDRARTAGLARVLFLDQDTEPGADGVAALWDALDDIEESLTRPACVGPRLIDVSSGMEHGFHQQKGWRWTRFFPSSSSPKPIVCAGLNGSGTLVPMEVIDAVGGLEDDFFIDHVDTEWSFRVVAHGYGLYGAPDVIFRHRMGQRTWRFWYFGWRIWPYRSSVRHRYLFRNAIRLMRRPYVPTVWKSWAVVKLGITFAVHVVFDEARVPQARAMLAGLVSGWRDENLGG